MLPCLAARLERKPARLASHSVPPPRPCFSLAHPGIVAAILFWAEDILQTRYLGVAGTLGRTLSVTLA